MASIGSSTKSVGEGEKTATEAVPGQLQVRAVLRALLQAARPRGAHGAHPRARRQGDDHQERHLRNLQEETQD